MALQGVLPGTDGASPDDHTAHPPMPETTPDPGLAPPADHTVAEVVDTRDGRQCTIYPADVDEAALVTTWITADEDAFVDLEEMR